MKFESVGSFTLITRDIDRHMQALRPVHSLQYLIASKISSKDEVADLTNKDSFLVRMGDRNLLGVKMTERSYSSAAMLQIQLVFLRFDLKIWFDQTR